MSFERPKSEDTEDDLLRFQREFLESGLSPAVKVIKKRKSEGGDAVKESKNIDQDRDVVEMDVENPDDTPKKLKIQNPEPGDEIHRDIEREMDDKDTHITTILSKITERDTLQTPVYFPTNRTNAFPSVYRRLEQQNQNKNEAPKKKSIFAQQFKKKSGEDYGSLPSSSIGDQQPVKPCALKPLPTTIPTKHLHGLYPSSNIVSGSGLSASRVPQFNSEERRKIHDENLEKLSGMSESEVLTERNKLLQEMDPKLIKFLQQRAKTTKSTMKEEKFLRELQRSSLPQKKDDSAMEISNNEQTMERIDQVEIPSQNYLHMDVVESDKLAWTEMIPEKKRKEIKLTHRFDFDGCIIKNGMDVPTHLGLHHHGEDPDCPGYTLQELFILSRSKFTQQRVFSITLIEKIIAKAKLGEYIEITSEKILDALLQSGLIFLLRWSIDEQSGTLLQASVSAWHALLCSSKAEDALHMLFVSDRGCEFPSLSPGVKIKSDENDYEVAEKDIVAGLIKMKILQRMRYILEVCKPGVFIMNQCLDILIRICQHSVQSAVSVYECPRLVSFIIKSLILPSGQDNMIQCKHPKAISLLRAICVAGRHVTSRLLKDHKHVETVIYKFIGDGSGDDDRASIEAEIEVWKLWIVICSYGHLCDIFRQLFSVIIHFIQSITTKLSKIQRDFTRGALFDAQMNRAHLVCKLCSTVLIATRTQGLSVWKEITDQIELLANLVVDCLVEPEGNSEVSGQLKILLGSSLDYLSRFCNYLKDKSNYDVEVVTEFTERISTKTIQKSLQCLENIQFPSEIQSMKTEEVIALPEIAVPSNVNCLPDFHLLSSYLQCCVAICSLNKNACPNFCSTIAYVADQCKWMLANVKMQSFVLRKRVCCLYWAVLLHQKLLVSEVSTNVMKQADFFYKIAFRCFGQLNDGDEHMAHHLLSNVLFHPVLLKSVVDSSEAVADNMASLDMTKSISKIAPMPSHIVESAVTGLPSIRATYLKSLSINYKIIEESRIRYFHKTEEIASYLLPSVEGTSCVPSDWPFIPLLQLYDQGISGTLPAGSLTHITNCLRFLCVLEHHCKENLHSVSLPAKLIRIMCVFIAGSDLFLEAPVKECLSFLFSHYCNTTTKEHINFSKSIPGISSFFDFYLSLLEQYESVSFGDELFSAVVLLPLHQLNGGIPDIKKALWSDRADLLRIMTIPISKLLIPHSWYLYPVENDVFIIRSYLRALALGNCSQARCPVLYSVAIHHTAGFLFDKTVDVPASQRREIYRGVLKIRSSDVRKHILHYIDPAGDDAEGGIGFRFSEEASESRKNDLQFLRI